LNPPNVPPIVRQTKTPSCSEDRRDCVQELSDWADQYRDELEKQCSARAAQVESLLIAGDYEAIHEWLDQWQSEDKGSGSLRSRYRETRQELRQERYRQRQHQLYGSMLDRVTGKASTKSLTRSGADLHSQTDQVNNRQE
jgi:exonuclease III